MSPRLLVSAARPGEHSSSCQRQLEDPKMFILSSSHRAGLQAFWHIVEGRRGDVNGPELACPDIFAVRSGGVNIVHEPGSCQVEVAENGVDELHGIVLKSISAVDYIKVLCREGPSEDPCLREVERFEGLDGDSRHRCLGGSSLALSDAGGHVGNVNSLVVEPGTSWKPRSDSRETPGHPEEVTAWSIQEIELVLGHSCCLLLL